MFGAHTAHYISFNSHGTTRSAPPPPKPERGVSVVLGPTDLRGDGHRGLEHSGRAFDLGGPEVTGHVEASVSCEGGPFRAHHRAYSDPAWVGASEAGEGSKELAIQASKLGDHRGNQA
jgi:hypothetical protein